MLDGIHIVSMTTRKQEWYLRDRGLNQDVAENLFRLLANME